MDFKTYVVNLLKTSRNRASVDDNDEVRSNIFHYADCTRISYR